MDCRTPDEYAFTGHAAMAYNNPDKLMTHEWNPDKKEYVMKDTPEFANEVKKKFKNDNVITVGRILSCHGPTIWMPA